MTPALAAGFFVLAEKILALLFTANNSSANVHPSRRNSPSRGPQRIGPLFTTAKILATDYPFIGKCEQQTVDPMPALELDIAGEPADSKPSDRQLTSNTGSATQAKPRGALQTVSLKGPAKRASIGA